MAEGGQLIPMPVDDPLAMAWLDTNDLGNAERLVRLARGLLLWVQDLGWVAYDKQRWSARDGERRAAQLAHDVARHIDREAAALDAIASDADKLEAALGWPVPTEIAAERVVALRKHAIKSGDASRTAAMLTQARTLITARREDFDADPLALNLQNGTLRFVQAQGGGWAARLDPHEPRDMLMQISRFVYDEAAPCEEWTARMQLIQPDRDQRALLQQIYGYALTGLTSEQKFFVYQGRGGDGKSLTNSVIAELLGDYHRHADVKTFLEGARKSGSDHSSDLARLQGDIRFVTCDEPTRNSVWDGTRLKQVTGGKITARPMRMEEIEYYAHWKLVVEVNPLPAVPSDDDGFWRRCKLIPWPYQFDKGGEDSQPFDLLLARLTGKEGSGILNWMIAGALRWLETRRLPEAKAAAEALDNYRQSASPLGEWLAECCDISDATARTEASLLYKHFKEWCEKAGIEKVPTQTAFGRALRDRQLLVWKDPNGNRWRKGIRFRPDFDKSALGEASADRGGGRAAEPLGTQDEPDWQDDRP